MYQSITPFLKNKNINEYLERLSEILIQNNLGRHSILIVGGAAMALKNKYMGRSTVDIDICIRQQNKLYDCCMQVASEYKLPEDWINADVMHSDSFSPILFDNAELYKVYNNILEIYIVSDIDLLCMKLVSFRQKDIIDIDKLIKRLRKYKITYYDIEERFKQLYGSLYLLKDRQRKYIYNAMKPRKWLKDTSQVRCPFIIHSTINKKI